MIIKKINQSGEASKLIIKKDYINILHYFLNEFGLTQSDIKHLMASHDDIFCGVIGQNNLAYKVKKMPGQENNYYLCRTNESDNKCLPEYRDGAGQWQQIPEVFPPDALKYQINLGIKKRR